MGRHYQEVSFDLNLQGGVKTGGRSQQWLFLVPGCVRLGWRPWTPPVRSPYFQRQPDRSPSLSGHVLENLSLSPLSYHTHSVSDPRCIGVFPPSNSLSHQLGVLQFSSGTSHPERASDPTASGPGPRGSSLPQTTI